VHSVQLAALAATLTSQKVTQYRADALGGDPHAASRLAGSSINLSLRLGDLGRPEEALDATQEAVTILRELAAARPEEFRPDLARALSNLSVSLDDMERPGALAAIQEAVGVYRELAAARPEEFRPHLAGALINLSVDLGRPIGGAGRGPGSRHHPP